jgi:hypothetical protein
MALRVEEVLSVWRDAERVLNELPASAPERPMIRLQVARLRRYHARLSTEVAPTSWRLLTSTHDALTETRRLLSEARGRVDPAPGPLDRPHRLMREWLAAEQALNRAGDDGADRASLMLAADEARERYQAALDEIAPDLTE